MKSAKYCEVASATLSASTMEREFTRVIVTNTVTAKTTVTRTEVSRTSLVPILIPFMTLINCLLLWPVQVFTESGLSRNGSTSQ